MPDLRNRNEKIQLLHDLKIKFWDSERDYQKSYQVYLKARSDMKGKASKQGKLKNQILELTEELKK